MAEEKHVYESEVIALPPLRMVLGEVPAPDPERQTRRHPQPTSPHEIEVTVKRLIAHLEEKK
ncbi:MAG: hypothetical protein ABSB41_09685 [Anaerolineales bacterium]|jgi:hypothetical protein